MVISSEHGGLVADAAPDISRLTVEMLEAKTADLDDASAGLDDSVDELYYTATLVPGSCPVNGFHRANFKLLPNSLLNASILKMVCLG